MDPAAGPADTLGTPRALDLDGSGESPVLAYLGGVARSSQSHWSVADSSPAGFALWAASRELVVSGGYSLSAVSFAAGPFLQTEPQPAAAVCGAWGRDPTDALVIGRDRSFLYDGSWTEVPGPPGQLPVPCPMWADETSYWVGGEGGAVHAREGATWVDYSLPNAGTVVGLGGADQVIYALVDADGDVTDDDPAELDRVYRYSANSWQEVFSDSGLTDLWVDEQGTVHLVGARCYRAEADDDWRPVILPADVAGRPIRIHGSAPDDVFALTDQSELLHLGDTGWTRVRGVLGGASTLFVTGSEVFVGSLTEVIALTRLAPW